MSAQGKGYTFTFISAICSASVYGVGKWVMVGVSPVVNIALTFAIATVVMGVMMIANGEWRDFQRCTAKGWFTASLFTIFTIAALYAMWTGIKHLDPTVASFIGRLQTVVAVFLGVLLLKERLRIIEIFGGLMVIAGVVVIRLTFDMTLDRWFWVMVTSGLLWGVTETVASLALRHLAPVPLNFVRNLTVAIVYLIWASFQEAPLFNIGKYWWGVVCVAFGGPILARIFYLHALKRIGVSKTALINQSQPIYVSVIALVFLGLIPTVREWIGGLLILSGCILMILGPVKAGIFLLAPIHLIRNRKEESL